VSYARVIWRIRSPEATATAIAAIIASANTPRAPGNSESSTLSSRRAITTLPTT